jgi:hypothetical protein
MELFFLFGCKNDEKNNPLANSSPIGKIININETKMKIHNCKIYKVHLPLSMGIYGNIVYLNNSYLYFKDSSIYQVNEDTTVSQLITFKRNRKNQDNIRIVQTFWSPQYKDFIYRFYYPNNLTGYGSDYMHTVVLIGFRSGIKGLYVYDSTKNTIKYFGKAIIKDIIGNPFLDKIDTSKIKILRTTVKNMVFE